MASETQPDVQIIANLVIQRPDGKVLLVRHDPEDDRWWLPGEDLRPYQHPDDRAGEILAEQFPGIKAGELSMRFVESFRGRRGWHVVFHYLVPADGEPASEYPTEWFPPDELPRTVHGRWERDAVQRVLGA
jgi:ADP-ribose pyrophosphatase YjhB (NUDIX family)